MFLVKLLKVLDFLLKLCDSSLDLSKELILLANLSVNSSKLCILMVTSFIELLDAALCLIELALKLFNSKSEASNIDLSCVDQFLQSLDLSIVLVLKISCLSNVVFKSFHISTISQIACFI